MSADIVGADAASILSRAAEIVRRGWCKGHDAMAKDGRVVDPTDPEARNFGARGALRRAASEVGAGPEVLGEAEKWLAEALVPGMTDVSKYGRLSVVGWNDTRGQTQSAIASGLAKASELARKELA